MISVLVYWCMQAASLWREHLQVHGQRSQLSSMNLKGLFFFLNLLTGRACFWGNTELRQVVLYYSDVFSRNFSFHREGSTVSLRKFDLNKMFGWPWSSLLLIWKDDLLQFHMLKSFMWSRPSFEMHWVQTFNWWFHPLRHMQEWTQMFLVQDLSNIPHLMVFWDVFCAGLTWWWMWNDFQLPILPEGQCSFLDQLFFVLRWSHLISL